MCICVCEGSECSISDHRGVRGPTKAGLFLLSLTSVQKGEPRAITLIKRPHEPRMRIFGYRHKLGTVCPHEKPIEAAVVKLCETVEQV